MHYYFRYYTPIIALFISMLTVSFQQEVYFSQLWKDNITAAKRWFHSCDIIFSQPWEMANTTFFHSKHDVELGQSRWRALPIAVESILFMRGNLTVFPEYLW